VDYIAIHDEIHLIHYTVLLVVHACFIVM